MTYAEALHVVGRAMRAGVLVSVSPLDEPGEGFGVCMVLEGSPMGFDLFQEAQLELDLAKLAQ